MDDDLSVLIVFAVSIFIFIIWKLLTKRFGTQRIVQLLFLIIWPVCIITALYATGFSEGFLTYFVLFFFGTILWIYGLIVQIRDLKNFIKSKKNK